MSSVIRGSIEVDGGGVGGRVITVDCVICLFFFGGGGGVWFGGSFTPPVLLRVVMPEIIILY